jgi:hypothetical protein
MSSDINEDDINDDEIVPIKVFIRLRPTATGAVGSCFVASPTSLTIRAARNASGSVLHNATESFHFGDLSAVYSPSTSQSAVFDEVARDVVQAAVLDGVDGCILAYGQTGAGKTFTMLGDGRSYEGRGLVARAIALAFQIRRRDTAIRFSMLELFEGRIIDLLTPNLDISSLRAEMDAEAAGRPRALPSSAAPAMLTVAEDANGRTFIAGLATPAVAAEGDALALLIEGSANRALAAHALNSSSTRAHAIMTLYFDAPSGGRSSRLDLVDLAGSERISKTGAGGARLREAAYINKSLSALSNVILALKDSTVNSRSGKNTAAPRHTHIPYRSSKLTHLLKASLGGGMGHSRLIAAIWPDDAHAEEGIATMRFASAAAAVCTRMSRRALTADGEMEGTVTSAAVSRALAAARADRATALIQVAVLRAELVLHDEVAGRAPLALTHAPLTAQEEDDIARVVATFVNEEDDGSPLLGGVLPSVRHGEAAFRIMRDMLRRRGGSPQSPKVAVVDLESEAARQERERAATTIQRAARSQSARKRRTALKEEEEAEEDEEERDNNANEDESAILEAEAQAARAIRRAAAARAAAAAEAEVADIEAERNEAEARRERQRDIEYQREREREIALETALQMEREKQQKVQKEAAAETSSLSPDQESIRSAAVAEWSKTAPEYGRFVQARGALKETRAAYSAAVAKVNATKKTVDTCLQVVAEGQISGGGSSEAVASLSAAKALYRSQHADAAALLKEAEYLKAQCDALEKIAASAFENVWKSNAESQGSNAVATILRAGGAPP